MGRSVAKQHAEEFTGSWIDFHPAVHYGTISKIVGELCDKAKEMGALRIGARNREEYPIRFMDMDGVNDGFYNEQSLTHWVRYAILHWYEGEGRPTAELKIGGPLGTRGKVVGRVMRVTQGAVRLKAPSITLDGHKFHPDRRHGEIVLKTRKIIAVTPRKQDTPLAA